MEKLLLTVEESAQLIGIGRTKMFELIAARTIESVLIGTARRVPRAAVADYVERLRSGVGDRRHAVVGAADSHSHAGEPTSPA